MESEEEEEEEPIGSFDNKYLIVNEEPLSEGKTSEVFIVHDKEENDPEKYLVAKKIKNGETPEKEKDINEEFYNELSVYKKLNEINKTKNNPYLLKLYFSSDKGILTINEQKEENIKYLILQYAENGSLIDYLNNYLTWFEERHAKLIFYKILKGIEILHNNNICHRDLKLENILLDKNYNPIIADFGTAKIIESEEELKEIVGTSRYYAPEISFFKIPYQGKKLDIFNLGVINFLLTNNKFPFEANDYDPNVISQDNKLKNKKIIQLFLKNNEKYWKERAIQLGKKFSDEYKELMTNILSFRYKDRKDINYILNESKWLEEIRDLIKNKPEEYKKLEQEVFNDFKEREKTIQEIVEYEEQEEKKRNEFKQKEKENDENNENNNGNDEKSHSKALDNEEINETFNLSLGANIQYLKNERINKKNYLLMETEINPCIIMNRIIRIIKERFTNACYIELFEQKIEMIVTINPYLHNYDENYSEEEDKDDNNEGEENKKYFEELIKEYEKYGINLEMTEKDFDLDEEFFETKIKINIYRSKSGGYVVKFTKEKGNLLDFNNYVKRIREDYKNDYY